MKEIIRRFGAWFLNLSPIKQLLFWMVILLFDIGLVNLIFELFYRVW